MSKFMLVLQNSRGRYCLFGAIFENRKPQPEYMDKVTRTTFAIIRPHKMKEGTAVKLLGYDKLSEASDAG